MHTSMHTSVHTSVHKSVHTSVHTSVHICGIMVSDYSFNDLFQAHFSQILIQIPNSNLSFKYLRQSQTKTVSMISNLLPRNVLLVVSFDFHPNDTRSVHDVLDVVSISADNFGCRQRQKQRISNATTGATVATLSEFSSIC